MKLWGIILILFLIGGCIEEKATIEPEIDGHGSISGKVIPADSSAKVQAIQNLTVVGETRINPLDGRYTIQELPEGQYGLLFTLDNTNDTRHIMVYIYNDEINRGWYREGELTVNETISVVAGQDSPNYDFNLSAEYEDYFADRVIVGFKPGVSEDEIKNTIQLYNCSIIKKHNLTGVGLVFYSLDIPDDKTVLEMSRNFQSHPYVEHAELDLIFSLIKRSSSLSRL